MTIKPNNTPSPKYPKLAAAAVAVSLAATVPACQQQQPVQGPPEAPPVQIVTGKY